MKHYADLFRALMDSPETSYKLQDALRAFDKRDPVDAFKDAETLRYLMRVRLDECSSK